MGLHFTRTKYMGTSFHNLHVNLIHMCAYCICLRNHVAVKQFILEQINFREKELAKISDLLMPKSKIHRLDIMR